MHYNFVRPHQGLNGMTPAEASGINNGLEDGWGDLIEKATEYKALKEKPISQVVNPLDARMVEVRITT